MTTNQRIAGVLAVIGWIFWGGILPGLSAMPPDWCPMKPEALPEAPCGTHGPCDDADEREQWIPDESTTNLVVRFKFIVFCNAPGPSDCAARDLDLNGQAGQLTFDFSRPGLGAHIQFEEVDPSERTFIYDPRFYDFCGAQQQQPNCFCQDTSCRDSCQSEEIDMKTLYADNPDGQVNVYVVRNLREATGFFGIGYWWFCNQATGTLGGVVVDGRCIGSHNNCFGYAGDYGNKTLTHEMGHNLGLYHVFRGYNEVSGRCSGCYEGPECPGLDPETGVCLDPHCDRVGDFCCDTPATLGEWFARG